MIDTWTSWDLSQYARAGSNSSPFGRISGYNFLGVHSVIREDISSSVIRLTPTASPNAYLGTNKWLRVAAITESHVEFRKDSNDRWYVRVFPDRDYYRPHGLGIMSKARTTYNIANEIGILYDSSGQLMEEGYLFKTPYTDVHFPAGTWQPSAEVFTLEPADHQMIARTTASPYDQRFRNTMVWGSISTARVFADMIPASDIWRYRVADIPDEGWAQVSQRVTGRGTGSTLEGIWKWLVSAQPQQNHDRISATNIHRPAVLILDDQYIGDEHAYMVTFRLEVGDTVIMDQVHPTASDQSTYRHIQIEPDTSLSGVLENREGENRRYAVSMPCVDVTPYGIEIPIHTTNIPR